MPKALEAKLRAQALKHCAKHKHKTPQERQRCIDAYVYGGLRKTGWKPKGER